MPAEKICDRLKGMDQQICGVKYEMVRVTSSNTRGEGVGLVRQRNGPLTLAAFLLLLCVFSLQPKEDVDLTTVDFEKMRVKELKQTLTAWGEKCEGCTEKGDFLRLVKKVLPKQIELQQAAKAAKAAKGGADKKDL